MKVSVRLTKGRQKQTAGHAVGGLRVSEKTAAEPRGSSLLNGRLKMFAVGRNMATLATGEGRRENEVWLSVWAGRHGNTRRVPTG